MLQSYLNHIWDVMDMRLFAAGVMCGVVGLLVFVWVTEKETKYEPTRLDSLRRP